MQLGSLAPFGRFPALVGAFLFSTALQPAGAVDWYRWRGPDLNGVSTEAGWATAWPADGPKFLWKASVGIGFSSFSVGGGRAYTMGNKANKDTVFCFDAATGREIWHYTYDSPLAPTYYEGGPSATPTIAGDRVYTLSKQGILNALEAASGKLIWTKDVPAAIAAKAGDAAKPKVPTWGFAGSVLVIDKTLYLNVGQYGSALDADGNVLWSTGPAASGYSTFVPYVMGGQKGLALLASQELVGVDPATGKLLWALPWKTQYDVNVADPIIQGDVVFVSSDYDRGCAAVRIADGKPTVLWENKNMRNHFNSCVLVNGYLFGWDQGSDLRCLDLKTGEIKWSEKDLGKGKQGAIMAADGKLIVQGGKGELLVAPAVPDGFKPTARAQVLGGLCWITPVLSNGRIYCRNAAGDVVCLDVSGK